MKYSMLFKYKKGVGLAGGEGRGMDCLYPLLLKLMCLFKIEIELDYHIKESFDGWEKEYIGKIKLKN